ncbi:MAG TPA: hypothetical protein DFS52_16495, partial [Myxococcales bacterium]|nr:hypothetical protein [Myxococcales bacterium]
MRTVNSKIWAAAWGLAVLVAAGCSEPTRCEDLTCGENAFCDEATTSCTCEPGFTGNPATGCVQEVTCDGQSCGDHGTCVVVDGSVICACDVGYAGESCDACAEGYGPEGSDCLTKKTVPCRDAAPANATSVAAAVEIAFEAGAWQQPTDCDWTCNTGFGQV